MAGPNVATIRVRRCLRRCVWRCKRHPRAAGRIEQNRAWLKLTRSSPRTTEDRRDREASRFRTREPAPVVAMLTKSGHARRSMRSLFRVVRGRRSHSSMVAEGEEDGSFSLADGVGRDRLCRRAGLDAASPACQGESAGHWSQHERMNVARWPPRLRRRSVAGAAGAVYRGGVPGVHPVDRIVPRPRWRDRKAQAYGRSGSDRRHAAAPSHLADATFAANPARPSDHRAIRCGWRLPVAERPLRRAADRRVEGHAMRRTRATRTDDGGILYR